MTREEIIEEMARRVQFIMEALTFRELRGWPNDPISNARIVYELHGWPFDRKDAAMIAAEARATLQQDQG
jgi:hypothetical protein